MKSEAEVKSEVRKALGMVARLFVNARGKVWAGKIISNAANGWEVRSITLENPRRFEAGLADGASDLIGWRSVKITPEMVGSKVAIFVAIETKPEKGNKLSPAQANFIEQVQKSGGLAGMARSVQDAKQILGIK